MIESHQFLAPDFHDREPKELALLSIISQSYVQPFSIKDNLLVILTALTSGSGVGFNRAMLFRTEGDRLKGYIWLGPRSAEEARMIWEVLSTPSIGYIEIIEHNRWLLSRETDSLSQVITPLEFSMTLDNLTIPVRAAAKREILLVRDAGREPLVDPKFYQAIGVDEFLCIPLVSQDDVLGEIILDNAYSRQPIGPKDIKLASLCGLMAANYISIATLHQKMIEMERLAALGEMAMFITHQLRNPLAAIGGFTDQILNGSHDETKKLRNLEIIRREIRRLEDVVDQLEHFLKVDPKKPAPFDLVPEMEDVYRALELQDRRGGVEFVFESEPGLPRVLGDPVYAGEAVRNLIVNAFEAMPGGGRVSLRVSQSEAGWVTVSIQDSGPGLSPAVKPKLFSPFLTTKGKGMGLGLLFVKRVMDSCGGRVEVESEAKRGTTFRLLFRAHQEGGSKS